MSSEPQHSNLKSVPCGRDARLRTEAQDFYLEDKVGCIDNDFAAVTSCSGWNLDLALFRRRSLLCLGQWLLCAVRGVRKFIFEGPLLSPFAPV